MITHTLGRPPLEEESAPRRGLYLCNTQHLPQTNIHDPAGFEPATPARELPQTLALDRAVTGVGLNK
jgi:hypothetical protein